MFDLGQYATVRQANPADEDQLRRLLGRKSVLHRHLGWHSSLFWLGKQPFYVLEDRGSTLLAALACPPDEAGLIWLRLFAVLPGLSPTRVWKRIWTPAREWYQEYHPGSEVNSLAISQEMEQLLLKSDFQEISRVVSLSWEASRALWPPIPEDIQIREMTPGDLPEIEGIDRAAFKPLWHNTLSQLQAAFSDSYYASVVLADGFLKGYQISTLNPLGGHIARLAVDPTYQGQGLGGKLLQDVLERMISEGIVEISVNTQLDNTSSLALYQKFGFKAGEESYPVLRYRA